MEDLFLPTLHTFENKNVFTGSWGDLRYKITPNIVDINGKDVDMDASSMKAEYWYGLFSYEKSEIRGEETFPLSEEGRNAMHSWLKNKRSVD